jgi:hypothetical protein
MNDQVWQSIRYLLIAGGMFMAGKGSVDMSQVPSLVDALMQVGGAAVSLGTAAWGFYVKYKTRAVPASVAARIDVPTVNAATGKVER